MAGCHQRQKVLGEPVRIERLQHGLRRGRRVGDCMVLEELVGVLCGADADPVDGVEPGAVVERIGQHRGVDSLCEAVGSDAHPAVVM